MNRVILIGRTTDDIELRYTTNEKAFARFTLAVNRRGKDEGADFISCVVWNKTAELMKKYVKKGNRISVVGRIQTGSYTNKENKKVYTTDVVVEDVEFLENGKKEEKSKEEPKTDSNGFTQTTQDPFAVEDEGLPFAKPF